MNNWVQHITWIGIAATVLVYAAHKGSKAEPAPLPPAINVDEVQAERWSHDGTQPFTVRDGNRAPNDYYEQYRELLP